MFKKIIIFTLFLVLVGCGGGGDDGSQGDDEPSLIVIDQLQSAKIDFTESFNEPLTIPMNSWIRFNPEDIEAEDFVVNCKIEANGDYGKECYTYDDENTIKDRFNIDSSKIGLVVYKESTGDKSFNSGEEKFGNAIFLSNTLNSIRVRGGFLGVLGSDVTYETSLADNSLTFTFNTDISEGAGISVSGDYVPLEGDPNNIVERLDSKTFVINFSSYTPGGSLTLPGPSISFTNFVSSIFYPDDIVYTFPETE